MKLISSRGCPILGIDFLIDFSATMAHSDRSGPIDKLIPTRLLNLKTTRSFHEHEVELGTGYQLQPQDVVCGNRNTRENTSHTGNARFKVLIDIRLERYRRSSNRVEKSIIVKEIVDAVRESGGNFVRFDSDVWVDIGNIKAREKAGAAIRAALKGESPTRRLSSSSSVGFGSTGSSESSGHLLPDPGVAFSSAGKNVGITPHDDHETLEPLKAMSHSPKPEGYDEFLRTSFLSRDFAHKVSVPSSNGDNEEVDDEDQEDYEGV